MPHIHDQFGQHDVTVTGYIIRTDTPEPGVLLHMHKKLGKLMPVGGHIEITETPWDAIVHELREESGYHVDELEVLQPKHRLKTLSDRPLHPYPVSMFTADYFEAEPGKHYHSDIGYAFIARGEPSGVPDEGESLDIRWLNEAELRALTPHDIFDNVREIYLFALGEGLREWDAVAAKEFARTV